MPLKIKLDADGHAVLQDGKIVCTDDETGKDTAIDLAGTIGTIARLNGEAKGHREGKESAEASLKAFAGITDPAAAIKAMQLTANLDAKKLIDAGEVDKVKDEINKGWQTKFDAEAKARIDAEGALYSEKIGGAFARSKFIADKIAVPGDMVQATFGQRFRIEDGKVAAYDASGNKVYSRAKPGEPADFEEALEILVDGYAYKDNILKGNSNGGAGVRQGQGGNAGAKTMTRAALDDLQRTDPAAAMKAMNVDRVTITE